MAADGTDLYCVFARTTDSDLRNGKNPDDGGWTLGQNFNITTATINHVSANVYTRAGTIRLAVVVLDGSTVTYDEFDLSAPATVGACHFAGIAKHVHQTFPTPEDVNQWDCFTRHRLPTSP
jgi:hypothetical protein